MNYLDDNRQERRRRSLRRMKRAQEEKLRRIKIYGCMGAIGTIVLVLIAWCVFGGKKDSDDSSAITSGSDSVVDAFATEDKMSGQATKDNYDDDKTDADDETKKQEETTAPKVYEYGDEVYSDGQLVVCLDAGHGGNDTGTEAADGSCEKDDDLRLVMLIKYQLEQQGVKVVLTRSTDVWTDLKDRPRIANEANADVLVAVHRNGSELSSVKGFEAWINSKDNDNSYDLASILMDKIEAVGISRNRGVRTGSMEEANEDYTVNCLSCMPSVLLEMGFMSSPTDNKLFKDNITDYAKAIAEGILQWSESQPY